MSSSQYGARWLEALVSKTFRCIHRDYIDLSHNFIKRHNSLRVNEKKKKNSGGLSEPEICNWKYRWFRFLVLVFIERIHYNNNNNSILRTCSAINCPRRFGSIYRINTHIYLFWRVLCWEDPTWWPYWSCVLSGQVLEPWATGLSAVLRLPSETVASTTRGRLYLGVHRSPSPPSSTPYPRGSLGHHIWLHNQFPPFFLCFPLPSGIWQTPRLSVRWCCLPISFFSACLVFYSLSLLRVFKKNVTKIC